MLTEKQIKDIAHWLDEQRIEDVEIMIADMSGQGRGKSMPPNKFLDGLRSDALRLPQPVYCLTITGDYYFGNEEDHLERDMILLPDPSTLCLTPWQSEPTASIICDTVDSEGAPILSAPRHALRHVLSLLEEKGWRPQVAPEFEFYLLKKSAGPEEGCSRPTGASGWQDSGATAFSIDSVDDFGDLFDEIYDYCEAQNIAIDAVVHEDGPAQFEINIAHGDPLNLADQSFYFKRIVHKAALAHGYHATFMAKPYPAESGSSMHLHQSIVDIKTGKNIFANEDGSDSELFLNYIGGLQKYLPAVMPMLAPYFNSYRRLAGRMSSPVTTHWGRENRTVGLRVPESGVNNRRVENRIGGSDTNPYLSIAASLACGYLGMVEGVSPHDPVDGNAYVMSSNRLPIHYLEALETMRHSQPLREVFGDKLIDTFVGIKDMEHNDFLSVLSPWETEFLTLNV